VCSSLIAFSSLYAQPLVSNINAAQREGTKLVDITYDIIGGTPTSLVTLSVTHGGNPVATPSVTGDVGEGVADGTGKTITWDGGADANGRNGNFAFSLSAVAVEAPSDYLVVDLSGGSSAVSYPVSELDEIPVTGWTSEYKTTKLVLRRIPAGTFTMGSPIGEFGRPSGTVIDVDDEVQHDVTLTEDFYIGVFELTQKQWELVMGSVPAGDIGDERPVEQVSYADIRGDSAGATWPLSGEVDPSSFIGKLRARTGLVIDLPTESQWEYACRAGTSRAYNDQTQNSGEGSDCLTTSSGVDANLDPLAWYVGNGSSASSSVGTKQANAWGLYDMHGNVNEWCLDWYFINYPVTDVDPVSDPKGAESGAARVIRGGSFLGFAKDARSASRNRVFPTTRASNLGLRVCSAPPISPVE
jgi:formylglycine-generating enzyme required for sulfatase activity